MKNRTALDSTITLAAPYTHTSVCQAVAALTEPQLNQLEAEAHRQLELVGNSPAARRFTVQHQARDFVQETIKLVLLGEVSPSEGCQVPVCHLTSPESFFDFLRDILHRLIHAGWLRFKHAGKLELAVG